MRQVLKEALLVAMMVGGLMPRFLCRASRLFDKL